MILLNQSGVNANSTAVENNGNANGGGGGDESMMSTVNNMSSSMLSNKSSNNTTNKESINGNLAEQYLNSLGNQSGGGVLFGAASKGIIKRDKQNNVGLFKTFYSSSNPFQQMDQTELEKYKNDILNK